MLVSFSVANFRSFREEQTLSLVASHRFSGSHDDHLVPIPGSQEKALRTAVLYGANGAGKSNLLKALEYVRASVLRFRDRDEGTQRDPFRLAGQNGEPTSFDLQFVVKDKLYRFGFKVDDERVIEEWLIQLSGGSEKVIYERVTDGEGTVKVDLQSSESAGQKIGALATVGGRKNQLFLSTIVATLEPSDFGEELHGVIEWFRDLNLLGPETASGGLCQTLMQDSALVEFAGDFLKASSTGVDHLETTKREVSPEEVRRLIAGSEGRILADNIGRRAPLIKINDGNELLVEHNGQTRRSYLLTIQGAHGDQPGAIVPLELKEESDGTRRLLNLIPVLYHLQTENAVYFIDEIERSMHPILVKKFLEYFLKSCVGGQILVTTHESNLLDLDLLRRDEIWFTEKDQGGATHLYSLADFKPRTDSELRKHYLEGRFGAIPFLGGLDRLLDPKEQLQE